MLKGSVKINEEFCKNCGLCVVYCPNDVLRIDYGKTNKKGYHPAFAERPSDCNGCAICAMMCPDAAITVYRGE